MIKSIPRPVIIAHRGASAHAPENTLSAMKLALEQGADVIELDVQLTADNKVVVIHDTTLDRTTNGSGKIRNLNLSHLQRLNAGYAYGPAFPDEKIPTLESIFDALGSSTYFNIDLKNNQTPFNKLPLKVSGIIKKYKLEDRVIVSSFNPSALHMINKVSPGLWQGLLLSRPIHLSLIRLFSFLSSKYQSIHISLSSLRIRTVKYLQQNNKLVFAYTINHPKDILYAKKCGLDGFFTDDPALARRTLSKAN